MNKADLELLVEAGLSGYVDKKDCAECCDTVAIEKMEDFVLVGVVVDNAVGIAIERATALVRARARFWWCSLSGLDVVCTALVNLSGGT